MDTQITGSHCSLCRQFDTLAKACEWCGGIFCKSHFMPNEHDCPANPLQDKNVFPICPICNKKIKIESGVNPNDRVSAHIDSGCTKFIFKKERKRPCHVEGCKAKKAPVQCQKCRYRFCVKHRFPDEHNCLLLPGNNPSRSNGGSHPLLAKLNFLGSSKKSNPKPKPKAAPAPSVKQKARSERKQKKMLNIARMRMKSVAKAFSFGSSKESKTKESEIQQENVLEAEIVRMKSVAKGNSNIEMEDRFYMEIFFSSDMKKDPLTMFFNRRHTCGKVLDMICKERKIICKNHIPDARRMVIFNQRTQGILPFDCALRLLEPQLMSGDTVSLLYEDEVPQS